jgi:hypothetical protein
MYNSRVLSMQILCSVIGRDVLPFGRSIIKSTETPFNITVKKTGYPIL